MIRQGYFVSSPAMVADDDPAARALDAHPWHTSCGFAASDLAQPA